MSGPLPDQLSELHEIASALASKKTIVDILSSLLAGARKITCADGGTIYLLDEDKLLHFSFMQKKTANDAGMEMSGRMFKPIPLHDDEGNPNRKHVSAMAVLDDATINLSDICADDKSRLSGIKNFDRTMHYTTKSILTVPIHNQQWEVIGVLQLVNCTDKKTGEIKDFSKSAQFLAEVLSFQAGACITHAGLQEESTKLLNRVSKLNQISLSLSSHDNTDALIEEVVSSAKSLTFADAGTIYLYKNGKLYFEVIQTDSLNIRMSNNQGNLNNVKPVSLYDEDGKPNNHFVSAHVALQGKSVNIPDIYQDEDYNFSGARAFDKKTGYRSKSFLAVPMRNKKKELIGVLQLINATDQDSHEIIPFSKEDQELAESLASMAAVALTNKRLKEELQLLLESFIEVISQSIDEKSPYTGGHCRRVPELAMMITRAACDEENGPLADFTLSKEEMYEMKIASMLHDCGKITTPVHVVDKGTKLETIHDRINLLDLRHEVVRRDMLIEELQKNTGEDVDAIMTRMRQPWSKLEEDVAFLRQCNSGSEFMAPEEQQRVRAIAKSYPWIDASGQTQPFLTEDEVINLNIPKGTLTEEERKIINNHIVSTIRMLKSLPFPKHLRKIPEIAGGHHERMDGKGYPNGLTRAQMSVPARILGIADIFEALTANDRPYKKSMSLSKALSILESMKDDGHIDAELFNLFIAKKLYLAYGKKFLNKEQMDISDYHLKESPSDKS